MKIKSRKVSMPMQSRAAVVQPKTLDKENRTVEVVFTTGSRVRRASFFDGPFIEELGLKEKEVRMGRLQSKAPFLDNHGFGDKKGVRNVLGVVESAELIPNKEGRATIRFSKRSEVDDIFRDVEDGILSNVSVGYNTHRVEKIGEENDVPIFRSTDWEPVEISLVPAGADPNAQVRSDTHAEIECEVIEKENENQNENNNIRDEQPKANELLNESEVKEKVAQPEKLRETHSIGEITMPNSEKEKAKIDAELKLRQEATLAEKSRAKEIRSIVAKVGLESSLADNYIEEDKSIDEVRSLVIDALAKKDKDPAKQTVAANETRVGEDLARKGRIEGMTNAILHRYRPADEHTVENGQKIFKVGYQLGDAGRQFAYCSLLDMARTCLEAKGVRTGEVPRHRLAEMALDVRAGLHSTSDFPLILENIVNKTLRDGYQAAPRTFQAFTREVFVNDFKTISRTNLGEGEKLEKLGEGSEVKRGTISEAAEKYEVEEYAKIISLSRKVIINDDLDAFTRLPERMGRRAADLESDLVWDIIKDNALLSDGVALFAAGHGNLSSAPAAPSEAGLTEGRTAMRRQLGLNGEEISIIPVWLYVPPAHETAAEKLLATIVPDSSTNFSPFSASGRTPLRLDVEPRLETGTNGSLTAWYMMADKGQVDMIELARLSGANGPQTSSREGFDVHGVEFKVMHDVGAKAIDFRGLFKNAGA